MRRFSAAVDPAPRDPVYVRLPASDGEACDTQIGVGLRPARRVALLESLVDAAWFAHMDKDSARRVALRAANHETLTVEPTARKEDEEDEEEVRVRMQPEGKRHSARRPKASDWVVHAPSADRVAWQTFATALFRGGPAPTWETACTAAWARETPAQTATTHAFVAQAHLASQMPFRGLFVLHDWGADQACVPVAVAEGMQHSGQVVVLTPARKRDTLARDLRRCAPLYADRQHWVFIPDDGRDETRQMLHTLHVPEFVAKHRGAFVVDARKAPNASSLSSERRRLLDDQLAAMARRKYQFVSYLDPDAPASVVEGAATVVVDDAPRFVLEAEKHPRGPAGQWYTWLQSAPATKVVALGTHLCTRSGHEAARLFNLVRGPLRTYTFPETARAAKLPFVQRAVTQEERRTTTVVLDPDAPADWAEQHPGGERRDYDLLPSSPSAFDALFWPHGELANAELWTRRVAGLATYPGRVHAGLRPPFAKPEQVATPLSAAQREAYAVARAHERAHHDAGREWSASVCLALFDDAPRSLAHQPLSEHLEQQLIGAVRSLTQTDLTPDDLRTDPPDDDDVARRIHDDGHEGQEGGEGDEGQEDPQDPDQGSDAEEAGERRAQTDRERQRARQTVDEAAKRSAAQSPEWRRLHAAAAAAERKGAYTEDLRRSVRALSSQIVHEKQRAWDVAKQTMLEQARRVTPETLRERSPKIAALMARLHKHPREVQAVCLRRADVALFEQVLRAHGYSPLRLAQSAASGRWAFDPPLDREQDGRRFVVAPGWTEAERLLRRLCNGPWDHPELPKRVREELDARFPETVRVKHHRRRRRVENATGALARIVLIPHDPENDDDAAGTSRPAWRHVRTLHVVHPRWSMRVVDSVRPVCAWASLYSLGLVADHDVALRTLVYVSQHPKGHEDKHEEEEEAVTTDEWLWSSANDFARQEQALTDVVVRASLDCFVDHTQRRGDQGRGQDPDRCLAMTHHAAHTTWAFARS